MGLRDIFLKCESTCATPRHCNVQNLASTGAVKEAADINEIPTLAGGQPIFPEEEVKSKTPAEQDNLIFSIGQITL